MEESLTCILESFNIALSEPTQYSPLVLAYIGDAVYEMIIRTVIISRGNKPVKKLHTQATHYVSAAGQAEISRHIKDMLSDEEYTVFKRGRNSNLHSSAKNATVSDYRHATGFEALIGFLYIKGKYKRAVELVRAGCRSLEDNRLQLKL